MKNARLTFLAAVLLCGCFNDSAYTPQLSRISSSSQGFGGVLTGTTQAQLIGQFFQPGARAFWNGSEVPVTFVSGTQLTLTLTQDQTAAAGNAQVTATNDGGLSSNAITANIVDAPLTSTGADPAQIAPGSQTTIVTVTGTGFRSGTTRLLWNREELSYRFVNSTTLAVTIDAALLANAGQGVIQVSNCQPQQNIICDDEPAPAIVNIGTSNFNTVSQVGGLRMVWDATHGLLFLSTAVSGGAGSITPLDPATGNVGTPVSTIALPEMSVSDQGLFLFSGSQQNTVPLTRYTLPSLTTPVQVTVPGDAALVAAAPGLSSTVAVAGGEQIFIVDDTTVRPNKLDLEATSIAWGFDATLYAVDGFAQLQILHLDASGVASTTNAGVSAAAEGQIGYDRTVRLLYSRQLGTVADETGLSEGSFAIPSQSSCTGTLDGALNRAFFACAEGDFGLTIRSFNIATRQPLGVVLLNQDDRNFSPPAVELPEAIVRFGADGVAVATFNNVHLYTGALVH
jgi:hypothetical protein